MPLVILSLMRVIIYDDYHERCHHLLSSYFVFSDDDSGFGFAGIRGALNQVSSSSGAVTKATAVATGDAVRGGRDVAVPVRFTVPLTASLEIVWDAILCRKALIVPRLPPNGAAGSKERYGYGAEAHSDFFYNYLHYF